MLPEPAGRSPQQQWRHTREARLIDRGCECRSVKRLGCDKRLQPSLGLHYLAPPRHASSRHKPQSLPRERAPDPCCLLILSSETVSIHLIFTFLGETTMTYRLPYAVAGRASHGDDVHAGYSPWPRGSGRVLSDSPGVHVVHFRLA